MKVNTIEYNEKNVGEFHKANLLICMEDLMNLACVIEKAFDLEMICDRNFWDSEMISLIELYKRLESYFEGSKYKDYIKNKNMLETRIDIVK